MFYLHYLNISDMDVFNTGMRGDNKVSSCRLRQPE